MQTIALAGIILFDGDGRILLQHRTDDAPTFPGYWSFFGGGVEDGETLEEAVKREIFEELEYRLRDPRLLVSQPFTNDGRHYTQHVYIEEYDGSDLVLNEGQAMAWFAPAATAPLRLTDHSRRAIEIFAQARA